MKRSFFAALMLLVLFAVAGSLAPSSAQTPASAVPVEKPLNTLPTPAELGKQFGQLLTGKPPVVQAAPVAATTTAPQTPIPTEETLLTEVEPQETFGTRALGFILVFADVVQEQARILAQNAAAFPQVSRWFNQQFNEPFATRWQQVAELVVLAVGAALIVSWLFDVLLLPVRHRILARRPVQYSGRIGTLLLWLLVAIVPLALLAITSLFIIDFNQPTNAVRLIVLSIIYALTLHWLVRILSLFFLAPRSEHLRLVPIATAQATYLQRWGSWLAMVMIYGYFLVDVARIVKVPAAGISFFTGFLGLIIVGMAITIILQKRAYVSSLLRGNLSVAQHDLTALQSMRLWLARIWHILAISYLVIGYIVTTLSVSEGFGLMVRGTIVTLLALLGLRLGLYVTERMSQTRQSDTPAVQSGIYRPVLKILLRIALWLLAAAVILLAWGIDVAAMLSSPWGQRVLGSGFSIAGTLLIVVVLYEVMQRAIEKRLNRKDADGQAMEINPRARTLLPMIRNAAMIILAVIVSLVTLSELGVNIAPLLAGAGIIGVAVGFGSQTLIKDFLTGLFIILEDTIAVGDVVNIGDKGGSVEGMTLRTVRLRDLDGALHIVPFSEISTVTNRTKLFAFAVIDLGVSYESDIGVVYDAMRAVAADLQADPQYGLNIMEPIEIMGVEKFADYSIMVRGRIKTRPGKQWEIKRAFFLRIKAKFDAMGISIPFPTTITRYEGDANPRGVAPV